MRGASVTRCWLSLLGSCTKGKRIPKSTSYGLKTLTLPLLVVETNLTISFSKYKKLLVRLRMSQIFVMAKTFCNLKPSASSFAVVRLKCRCFEEDGSGWPLVSEGLWRVGQMCHFCYVTEVAKRLFSFFWRSLEYLKVTRKTLFHSFCFLFKGKGWCLLMNLSSGRPWIMGKDQLLQVAVMVAGQNLKYLSWD